MAVASDGTLDIDNTVTAETNRSLVTFGANGLVTGGSPIEPADLPAATCSAALFCWHAPDGCRWRHGHWQRHVAGPGTYVKVVVNDVGLVTQGLPTINATDIAGLSYDGITQGQIQPGFLAPDSVEPESLVDYSSVDARGQPWEGRLPGPAVFTPSTAQLRVYARGSGPENVWSPVGGALQAANLRWAGTYDASTNIRDGYTDWHQRGHQGW